MGLKTGTGKILVFFFTIAFSVGVIVSCSSPAWIEFAATNGENGQQVEVQYGPFYSQTRTCVTSEECSAWTSQSVDLSDCDALEGSTESKLCSQLNTWRALAIVCFLIVVVGGFIVLAGSCCQCFTCGCCGASMDCIANVIFWIEVILSIVAWSFAIASLNNISESPQVLSSGYLWAFWLFIASGTILGAFSACTADWAAEKSCFRGIFRCITCRCNKD